MTGDDPDIERIALVVAISVLVAVPAAASSGPRAMVLDQRDVPRGYWRERNETFAMRDVPYREQLAKPFRRFGFTSGYYTTYRDTSHGFWRTIQSVAYVFRTVAGARQAMRALTRHGSGSTLPRLGAGGILYVDGHNASVVWRRGRVVASVSCQRVPRLPDAARRLAHKQDRRVAAALR